MNHQKLLRFVLTVTVVLSACGANGAPQASSAPQEHGPSALRELAAARQLRAAFLVVDGVYTTELTAPWDILDHTLHHAGDGLGIDVFTVSPTGEPVTTAEGLAIVPDFGFGNAPSFDILVVPSAEGSRDSDLEDRVLVDWVAQKGREARLVMSLCWGAFVLAEADLLDNRSCTTFPSDFAQLAQRHPDLDVMVNVSFVHDGPIITSVGGTRSFDAAMYLVELLYGSDVARGVGSGLLIDWPPDPRSGIDYHVAH